MTKLFDLGAKPYDRLIRHQPWRDSCAGMVDRFPPGDDLKVLDIGIGPGISAVSMCLARGDLAVVGIDPAGRMLGLAQASVAEDHLEDRITLCQADGAALPFADNMFDVVTAHSVLYLVADREGVLTEALRILRPGGRCVFMEPNSKGSAMTAVKAVFSQPRYSASMLGWRWMSLFKGRFSDNQLVGVFEEAGFQSVTAEAVISGLGLLTVAEKPHLK